MAPMVAIYSAWGAWAVSWGVAAIWSSHTTRRPGLLRELPYRFVTTIGVILLFGAYRAGVSREPLLWNSPPVLGWAMFALTVAGFLFCWWARIHLGTLWSGSVTRKAGHHIIDTGPYGLVRHPIYTGISLASFSAAIATGRASAIVGAFVMLLAWYMKARLEENFLRGELGQDAYDSYAARVPMLIPFVRV